MPVSRGHRIGHFLAVAAGAQPGGRVRLVDGAQQIFELAIIRHGKAALETTPQPFEVTIGKQPDRDDMLLRQCPNSGELVVQ